MSIASAKMGKAKAALVLEQAFFASIICSLQMIEDDTLNPPTMATNGKWVRYHPQFVEEMDFDEVKFVLCHEVGHCIFQHMFRRGSREHRRWNQAGDYVINDMLVNAKVGKMPQQGLHNPALVAAGKGTTDGVYDLLPPSQDDGNGGQSNGHGDPLDDCQDQGGSASEQATAEAEMKVMVAQAAQAAKMCGQMTSEIARMVDGLMKPKVDWKDVLRRFVQARAKVERSWARPNRRFLGDGLYMPAMAGEKMGKIACAIDVSGSISPEEVQAYFSELRGIKDDVRPETMEVIYFHHVIDHHDTFQYDEELEPTEAGSGGTAFSPIFKLIEDKDLDPVCCVVLTDLYCSDFGVQPKYPVLWITTGATAAPWGDVVEMKGYDQ